MRVSLPPRQLFAGAVGAAALTASALAPAQVPSLDLRRLEPSADPTALITLEGAATPGPGAVNFGLLLAHGIEPVRVAAPSGFETNVIEQQLTADALVGLGLGDRVGVYLTLPMLLFQKGDADDDETVVTGGALPRTGVGDVALGAKVALVVPGELGGPGLAIVGRGTLPSGARTSYLGDGAPRLQLRVLGEYATPAGRLLATAGGRFRTLPRELLGAEYAHDIPLAAGLEVRPKAFGVDPGDHFRVFTEFRGAVAVTGDDDPTPRSYGFGQLGVRYRLGDGSATLAGEVPLGSGVGVPRFRSFLAVAWAPRFIDEDHDGVRDDQDHCVGAAEDRDGFEDHDGCPELDNDDDGVFDEDDRCPTVKEDEDFFEDDDGCPDPDNDGDGIPDASDGCPDEAGDAARDGCPVRDQDGDGIPDDRDDCPAEAEDVDGHDDQDGCPDPDNDGDGVPDAEDVCRDRPGEARSEPEIHGCPSPDRDGDGIDDGDDRCPGEPEDYDGVEDDDGCPEERRGAPLFAVVERGDELRIRFARPPRFARRQDLQLDDASMVSLRALAAWLNGHPARRILVAVRPRSPDDTQGALNRALVVVLAIRRLTHRDATADVTTWDRVPHGPGARATGLGFAVAGREETP